MSLSFTVLGTPVSQGSKRFVGVSRAGRGIMIESSKRLPAWRDTVTWAAREAKGTQDPFTGPINLNLTFRLKRPKAHYRTGKHAGELKSNAPLWVATMPDLSKLIRAVEDSLTTAGVWNDDSQVATIHARKVYATADSLPGVRITVQPLPEGDTPNGDHHH